jgi:hypothetical protein
MRDLYFVNPTFDKKTLNLTVRRGEKWKDYQGEVKIKETGTNNEVGTGKVVYSENIPFNELTDKDLILEHDEDCRTKSGLFDVMSEIYDGFSENESVSLLYFKVK